MSEAETAISTDENPEASWITMSDEDKEASKKIGDFIGMKVHSIATRGWLG